MWEHIIFAKYRLVIVIIGIGRHCCLTRRSLFLKAVDDDNIGWMERGEKEK